MKLRNLFQLALLASVITFIAPSCVKEGPIGASGADGTNGTNGTDGTATCLSCHDGTVIEAKKAEFYASEHSLGAVAVESEGGTVGCSRCYSSQGFIEYATLGAVQGTILKPTAWECATCHGIHTTFAANDFALRLEAPVKSNISATYMFDFKNNSNLCVNCHQARTAEPNIATPGTTFKVSVRIGPHHGPQGNIVAGVGFAEIAGGINGITYPAPGVAVAGTKDHFNAACTGCHMAPNGVAQGGHSLIPNLVACNTCHGATELDYNHGGKQTLVKGKMIELRDRLVSLGLVIKTTDATTGLDTYAPKSPNTVPMVQAQALYNYFGLVDDRSNGVHNPKYVTALLINSLEALKAF